MLCITQMLTFIRLSAHHQIEEAHSKMMKSFPRAKYGTNRDSYAYKRVGPQLRVSGAGSRGLAASCAAAPLPAQRRSVAEYPGHHLWTLLAILENSITTRHSPTNPLHASTLMRDLKAALIAHAKTFAECKRWDTLLDYLLFAFGEVAKMPFWDADAHNKVGRGRRVAR